MMLLGLVLDLPHESVINAADVPVPGEAGWLIDENGDYVLDENGQRIPVL